MSMMQPEDIASERELAALCVALGAGRVAGWSRAEEALAARAPAPDPGKLAAAGHAIRQGRDILGQAFCALRSPATRRADGATYTPAGIVDAMVQWARTCARPRRVVDPGAGSGRFLLAAARAFPRAALIGVESDPLAALMARANLAAAGVAARAQVLVADYRDAPVRAGAAEQTLFIGNPPYVRHHAIAAAWKDWLGERAAAHGLRASKLAGLHVHFLMATLEHARPGDKGALITSAEWLDVNYGRVMRELLRGPLGCTRMDLIEPAARPFADAHTTAVITCFDVGAAPPSVRVRRVAQVDALAPLAGGRRVGRERLASTARWTRLWRAPVSSGRGSSGRASSELIELGELCRVHRGQVTGANALWIAGAHTPRLPGAVLYPAVTRARELFDAGGELADDSALRRVIDLPADLDALPPDERDLVERFLIWARERGAHQSYIARHREPWWSVKLRAPAPILATYMARRPPAFVRNRVAARVLNIAHGLYPRAPLAEPCLDALAAYLGRSVATAEGRTYAGGLTKFEPKEMERLLVPRPDILATDHADVSYGWRCS